MAQNDPLPGEDDESYQDDKEGTDGMEDYKVERKKSSKKSGKKRDKSERKERKKQKKAKKERRLRKGRDTGEIEADQQATGAGAEAVIGEGDAIDEDEIG